MEGQQGRTHLSRRLYRIWNWQQANGAYREIACRDLLRQLQTRGLITLLAPLKATRQPGYRNRTVLPSSLDTTPLEGRVDPAFGGTVQIDLLIVNNHRFLILPWIKIANLASGILAQITRRLRHDWQTLYTHDHDLSSSAHTFGQCRPRSVGRRGVAGHVDCRSLFRAHPAKTAAR